MGEGGYASVMAGVGGDGRSYMMGWGLFSKTAGWREASSAGDQESGLDWVINLRGSVNS